MVERQRIQSFTDLESWKEAHRFVLAVYNETRRFPKEELYGLTNQLQRSAVSITSNIAEGFARQSKKDKCRFYNTALGSLAEAQNQLLVARDLGYITNSSFQQLAALSVQIRKLVNGLMKSAQTKKADTGY